MKAVPPSTPLQSQVPPVMTTASLDEGQIPLVMVHVNVFAPTPTLFTTVVGEFALAKLPDPVVTVQVPEPTAGALAARVKDDAHKV